MKSALSIVILLGLVSLGAALKCYTCNSHEDKDCTELPENSRDKYLMDCNESSSSHNYTLCRKLHMFMDQDFGEQHPSEDRVHRACGYAEDDGMKRRGDCYYKSGYNTRTWVCSCKFDKCNGGPLSFAPSAAVAVLVPTAALVMGYLRSAADF